MHPDWLLEVPSVLSRSVVQAFGDSARVWLNELPNLTRDICSRWSLDVIGHPQSGFASVVVPVQRQDQSRAMLKLTYPAEDQDLEADVLIAWDGHGAVRLLDQDVHAQAKLLERLGDRRLFDLVSADEALTVSAALARQLAAATPPPTVPRLKDIAATWVEQIPRLAEETGYSGPGRVLNAAIATCRELGPDQPENLLHGDLHGRNILAADRAAWLAIDPLGMVGEVSIECLTAVRDRWTQLRQHTSPTHQLHHQLRVFAEAAETSLERTIAWTQARATLAALRLRRSHQADDDGLHQWVAQALV